MKKPLRSFDAPLQMKEAGWNGRLNESPWTQRPGSILCRCNDFSPQYVFVTHFSQADSPLSEMTALCSKVFVSPRSVQVSQYLILFGDKSKGKITTTCKPESIRQSSPRR